MEVNMLIVKVLVNDKQIDEIGLINTGHRNEKGEYLYRFKIPADLNHHEIYHNRDEPWHILVGKALVHLKHRSWQPPS
jgi:hypothetical protein